MKFICGEKNSSYLEVIKSIISHKKVEVFEFFNVNNVDLSDCTIYLYDSGQELVDNMKRRGFADMPDYMCACMKDEDCSLNFFEPSDDADPKTEWTKEEYEMVVFHELIHLIQFKLYGTQPEWLTEGVAKYLDGQYSKGVKYVVDNYIDITKAPLIDELENNFGFSKEYDSYDYAYLIVNYLIDKFGHDKFINIIADDAFMEQIRVTLIPNAIVYYS